MPSFKVSGLYEGLFVMRDSLTQSEWLHYTGECIAGPSVGRTLPMVDATTMMFGAFKRRHPDGTVVDPVTSWWRRLFGRLETHPRLFFLPGMFRRTLPAARDERLPESTLGLGVIVGRRNLTRGERPAAARFYSMEAAKQSGLIVEEVGGARLAIVMDPALGAPVAYLAERDGAPLGLRRDGDTLVDDASGASWDLSGRSRAAGPPLRLAPGIFGRFYGFAASYPGCTIYGVDAPK